MMKNKVVSYIKNNYFSYIPLLGMILVIVFFAIATGGKSLSGYNLQILVNQSVITAILATGAVFVFSMGMIDISLGAAMCVTCVVAAKVGSATGSIFLIILVCLVSAVVISLINGICVANFKLPSFIVTLATMNILSALASVMVGQGNTSVSLGSNFLGYDNLPFKLICLAIITILGVYLFNIRDNGRKSKFIGGNAKVAVLSGVKFDKYTVQTFIFCGLAVGFASLVLLLRVVSISSGTGSSYGFDVIIAIVLGGMPISGGARSKISAGIIGAVTITALNNGLVMMGVGNGWVQIVRGLLFLTTVVLMNWKNKTGYLQ